VARLGHVPAFRERWRTRTRGGVPEGIEVGCFPGGNLVWVTGAVVGAVVPWMRAGLAQLGSAIAVDRDAQFEIMLAIVGVDRGEVSGLTDRLRAVA